MAVPKRKNARVYIKSLLLRKQTFKLLNNYNIINCIYCKKNKKNEVYNNNNLFINNYKLKTMFTKQKICKNCIKRLEKKKKKIKKNEK